MINVRENIGYPVGEPRALVAPTRNDLPGYLLL
jgi:hypothetical protein